VTLPTGGTISYTYTGGSNGITCADGSAATLQRVTPDGTWIYSQVKNAGAASTTTITDPSSGANQTVIQFQSIYETSREAYQGSSGSGSLMGVWTTCYNGNPANCATTAVTTPITERDVFSIYGTSGPQSRHTYKYNSAGGLSEQDDYDFGPSGPGPLLRQTLITYQSLTNITAFRQSVTVKNGSGTTVAQTNYNYDQYSLQLSSDIAQHVSVTSQRGNLTSINYPVSGLTASFYYWDTGSPNFSIDVNNAITNYNYSSNAADCQMAFPTSITEAIGSMTQQYTWNCTGGVMTQLTDENGQTVSTSYTDPYFWRPATVTDQEGNSASLSYGINPTWTQQSLLFNNGNSVAHTGLGYDGLGRLIVANHAQTPSPTAWDQLVQSYDSNGRPWKISTPCVTTGSWSCPTWGATTTYDALNRVSQTTDAGGGTTTYRYPTSTVLNNDVLVTIGPPPSGENTKKRQFEYDGLGRLTSVCEITTLSGSGSCGQNSPQTGYWTKYTYDALGDLLTVTQNAQATSSSQQTRTYTYDAMGRLTSETNPESGTTSYTYDTIASGTCAATYYGDLIKRVDANGNITCYAYDQLHRLLATTYTVTSPTVATASKCFIYNAVIDSQVAYYTKARLAEAYTTTSACSQTTLPSIITDEAFSYTPRGELTSVYQLTPQSGSYYNVSQSYWPNGAPDILSGNIGLPTLTYGADGEGRSNAVSTSSGQVSSAYYYNLYQSPNQLTVTFGSGDSDVFSLDPNTMRMNKYQFNVGSNTVTGAVGWNANWSLGSLNITDPFSSANTQNCSFSADDLARTAQANCGTIWGQNFSYDPFGNIQQTAIPGDGGITFAPCYNSSTPNNQIALVGGTGSNCTGGTAPHYDANGNSINDTFRTYAWDAENRPTSIGSVSLIYDALGRAVEQTVGSNKTDIVYSPTGVKLALMNATSTPSLAKAFVPLPAGDTAVYTSSTGPAYFRHTDHLGSSRFASTMSQTLYADYAYSPFGQPYAQSGAIDPSFTGQNQDALAGLYDFLYREYDPYQARWTQPDPAGLTAADPTHPQSWNRYAYVLNNPLSLNDPVGLSCDYYSDDGQDIESIDYDSDPGECADNGGKWISDSNGEFAGCPPGAICVTSYGNGDVGGPAFMDYGGFASQIGGAIANGIVQGLKNAACSIVPEARTTSLTGSAGELIGFTGSTGQLVNYDTGEVSNYLSGGYFAGFNGLLSGTLNVGFVSNLQGSNSNYGGPFTTAYGGVDKWGLYRSSSGGIAPVTEWGATMGTSIIPSPVTGGGSYTEYGVVPAGNVYTNVFSTPGGMADLAIFAARQACNGKG
jgi:RHS repeat-associated protein